MAPKIFFSHQYIDLMERVPLQRLVLCLKYIDFKKNDSVLDIGCGPGLIINLIYKKIRKYTGVDFSSKFIIASKLNAKKFSIKNARFICTEIPIFFKKNQTKYSKVLIFDFAYYIETKKLLKMLKMCNYAMEKKGYIYLYESNKDFFFEILKRFFFKKNYITIYPYPRNSDDMKLILENAGFKSLQIFYLPHFNLLRFFHPLISVPLFGKYFAAKKFVIGQKP